MQNLVVVSHLRMYVCTYVEVPKLWERWDPAPCDGCMTADPLVTHYFPTCYHTKFRHSKSNSIGVGRGAKNFRDAGARRLGTGAKWPPKNMLLATCFIMPISVHSTSHTSVIMEIHQRFAPSRPAFQSHSRSLEPTRIDRLHYLFICFY